MREESKKIKMCLKGQNQFTPRISEHLGHFAQGHQTRIMTNLVATGSKQEILAMPNLLSFHTAC